MDEKLYDAAFAPANHMVSECIGAMLDAIQAPQLGCIDYVDVGGSLRQLHDALFGMGVATGKNRGSEAADNAVSSIIMQYPLRRRPIKDIYFALVVVTGSSDMELNDYQAAVLRITESLPKGAYILPSFATDDALDEAIKVALITNSRSLSA